MSHRRLFAGAVLTLPLILAGCLSAAESPGTETSAATATPTEAPAATPTPDAASELPETPVTAVLDEEYATEGAAFDPADVGGLEPGDVEAHWYVSGDSYVVAYVGLDLEATGPLCPGNSMLADAPGSHVFQHIWNAPTEEGACIGLSVGEPPIGVYLCGEGGRDVVFRTGIPSDASGQLFGSIERWVGPPGNYLAGITSTAATSDEVPEIDLDALDCEPAVDG